MTANAPMHRSRTRILAWILGTLVVLGIVVAGVLANLQLLSGSDSERAGSLSPIVEDASATDAEARTAAEASARQATDARRAAARRRELAARREAAREREAARQAAIDRATAPIVDDHGGGSSGSGGGSGSGSDDSGHGGSDDD
jgi:membrane protein involved in colicin uptake